MHSILAVIAAFFFLVGLGLLAWILVSIIGNIRRRPGASSRKSRVIWRVIFPISGILLIVLSQLLFWVDSSLDAYTTVQSSLPLGTVSFHESGSSGRTMTVALRSNSSEEMMQVEILMRSNAAILEVETIRFAAPFKIFGLTEYYRISRIKVIDTRNPSPEPLYERKIQPKSEAVWTVLDEIGRFFPIAKTSKFISEPVFFKDGAKIHVFSEESRILLADIE